MNQIQKTIQETIVEPRLAQGSYTTYGFIIEYNANNNTSVVNVFDKTIGRFVVYKDVPMMDKMDGVISTDPKNRSAVWVEFVGGNKNTPRVSSMRPDVYNKDSQASDNGQAIPDIGDVFASLGKMISGVLGRWE
jgi:hypothetical protein